MCLTSFRGCKNDYLASFSYLLNHHRNFTIRLLVSNFYDSHRPKELISIVTLNYDFRKAKLLSQKGFSSHCPHDVGTLVEKLGTSPSADFST